MKRYKQTKICHLGTISKTFRGGDSALPEKKTDHDIGKEHKMVDFQLAI